MTSKGVIRYDAQPQNARADDKRHELPEARRRRQSNRTGYDHNEQHEIRGEDHLPAHEVAAEGDRLPMLVELAHKKDTDRKQRHEEPDRRRGEIPPVEVVAKRRGDQGEQYAPKPKRQHRRVPRIGTVLEYAVALGQDEHQDAKVIGNGQGGQQPAELAQDEYRAAHGLGNHRQDRLVLDFSADHPRCAESGQEQPAEHQRRKP